MIKSSEPISYREEVCVMHFGVSSLNPDFTPLPTQTAPLLPYTYEIGHGLPSPAVFLTQPLLGELFGAGFTKSERNLVRW